MKPFEKYQLEELQTARKYIDHAWKCKNAHMVTRAVILEGGQLATFHGLTHDTHSVCAVVLPYGEAYIRLVHYSGIRPLNLNGD